MSLVTCRRVNITSAAYIYAGMSIDSVVLSGDRQLELNRIAQSRLCPPDMSSAPG